MEVCGVEFASGEEWSLSPNPLLSGSSTGPVTARRAVQARLDSGFSMLSETGLYVVTA